MKKSPFPEATEWPAAVHGRLGPVRVHGAQHGHIILGIVFKVSVLDKDVLPPGRPETGLHGAALAAVRLGNEPCPCEFARDVGRIVGGAAVLTFLLEKPQMDMLRRCFFLDKGRRDRAHQRSPWQIEAPFAGAAKGKFVQKRIHALLLDVVVLGNMQTIALTARVLARIASVMPRVRYEGINEECCVPGP